MSEEFKSAFVERFDGSDYDHSRDGRRLSSQYDQIFQLMKDGVWRTMTEIEEHTGYPQASISAQLRHARKPRFGLHTINKVHVGEGLYKYQLVVNETGTENLSAVETPTGETPIAKPRIKLSRAIPETAAPVPVAAPVVAPDDRFEPLNQSSVSVPRVKSPSKKLPAASAASLWLPFF